VRIDRLVWAAALAAGVEHKAEAGLTVVETKQFYFPKPELAGTDPIPALDLTFLYKKTKT
jgi:hypothetical protein